MGRRAFVLPMLVLALVGCGDDPRPGPVVPDIVIECADEGGGAYRAVELPPDLAPTYSEDGRHAWSLDALFGAHERGRGARVHVCQADGTVVDIDRPFVPEGGRIWVLRTNRKGDAQLALVDPAEPFPTFHGRGGARGRAGDERKQIRDVVRLQLDRGTGSRPEGRKGKERLMLQLEVVIDGVARKLDEEALADLDPIEVQGDSGEGKRDAWSVRALVAALAGEGARLAQVKGRGDEALDVAVEAWADQGRVALLKLNRRGRFKFHWADSNMAPSKDDAMRDVTTLVIVTR